MYLGVLRTNYVKFCVTFNVCWANVCVSRLIIYLLPLPKLQYQFFKVYALCSTAALMRPVAICHVSGLGDLKTLKLTWLIKRYN